MSAKAKLVPADKPYAVFKVVYIILLLIGLWDVGMSLAAVDPGFLKGFVGPQNSMVGKGLYWGTLITTGLYTFSVYLAFEAFEDRRCLFSGIRCPQHLLIKAIEVLLRFLLVVAVTVKLWKPASPHETVLFVLAISVGIAVWGLLVRIYFGAALTNWDAGATIALAVFAWGLKLLTDDPTRETEWALLVALVMFVVALLLVGAGLRLLVRLICAEAHGAPA
ncbi:MAG: hypothetical protein J5X22_00590 [Candidatus Accumulibacter sp.]|uniref:hypothetical protein n=1 Tax=Accumulibacter sp. TaxID=2053492 RepID=UPI001AFFEBE5|nr:hypothetical protein [Accumulibacter sp.]MBO3709057.1 hypothetical protein [Accumulibacter sp.]